MRGSSGCGGCSCPRMRATALPTCIQDKGRTNHDHIDLARQIARIQTSSCHEPYPNGGMPRLWLFEVGVSIHMHTQYSTLQRALHEVSCGV